MMPLIKLLNNVFINLFPIEITKYTFSQTICGFRTGHSGFEGCELIKIENN